jgi:hypothetical protein
MASDAKVGLLAGLAAVVLVAVIYFQKYPGMPGTNIPGQVPAEPAEQPGPGRKPFEGNLTGKSGTHPVSEADPIIHLPKPPPPPRDVFVRPLK